MKSFIPGLIVGILVAGIAGYLILMPQMQEAHTKGYNEGNAAGITAGTAKGIAEGREQGLAEEKARQQKATDSLSSLLAKKKEVPQRKPREEAPKIQNWHVMGGQLQDPITDTSGH